MKKNNLIIILLATLFFISCEEKLSDLDKVTDAQDCLDQYTVTGSGNLDTCLQKVDGLETSAAFNIRCSVGYIREGKTTSVLINAFSELETVTQNSVEDFLGIISFKNAGTGSAPVVLTNYNNANETNNNCARSLAKGATILSTYTFITNTLYKYSCDNVPTIGASCGMTSADIASGLAAIAAGGLNPWTTNIPTATIGAAVIQAKTVSCSTGAANETLCDFIDRAITNAGGASSATAVGTAFVNVLITP